MKIPTTIKFIFKFCIMLQCLKQSHNIHFFSKDLKYKIKVLDKYVYSYMGIPFAAPPIGDLRFRDPQELRRWISAYNESRKSPSCMQDPVYNAPEWLNRHPKDISEDCLYLNVWVPSCESVDESLTTMVWIYGGAFNTESSAMDIYDGAILASIGNVIVVTFNYRLGAFGYANFDRENARGNIGMLDQVMALKWVHRNIVAFGGDRHKITIFGKSAGSIAVAHHLISPLTKGLFTRAILQSGSNYHKIFAVNPEVNMKLITILSTELGCNTTDMLNCMRKLNASDIAASEKEFLKRKQSILSFLPESSPPFLPDDPFLNIDNGKFHDVDVLVGETKDEGSLFLTFYRPEFFLRSNPILTIPEAKYILSKFYEINEVESLNRIVEEYFGNLSKQDHPNILKHMVQALGQGSFTCPSFHLAEKLSANNGKIYHYTFNHTDIRSELPKWMGVPHSADVPYVFGMPFVRKNEYTREEVRFSKRIIELWTSFAKTGVPSYENMEHEWKPFNQHDRYSFSLSLEDFRLTKAEQKRCTFWKDFYRYG